MGEEGMEVERCADGITVSCGVIMDRGVELEECRVRMRKYTGNFNECTSKGENF